ncbi:hypothetical protein GSI_00471 [Ganoderma sinense ZZ0214-1]|uniref:C3H1-type domain-containing protein n=1 Tax=Ganoderma sinense ZZ0214-1 TaxID=1077348 RepID=A0A2G8SSM2_9APHY|nr:hypothetical protein GSI_00471 [Ganoderma sinense ZZ0214-1]
MEENKICFQFADSGRCRFGDRCRFEHVGSSPKQPKSKAKKKNHKVRRSVERDATNHIAAFFAMYPTYPYDPAASFVDEFKRLNAFFAWPKHPAECDERDLARNRMRDAMVKQFNNVYGTDVEDLVAWQNLCRALEVDPIPSKMRKCRTAVMGTHVNICDLIDAPLLGKPKLFATENELADYSKSTGKIFPRSNIYAGSLLRYLLRHIFH